MSSPYPLHQHHHHLNRAATKFWPSLLVVVLLAEFFHCPSVAATPDAYSGYDDTHHPPHPRRHQHQRRMVCNNGTDYQCICRNGTPDTEPIPPIIECDEFIQSLELPVVDMRLRNVNLEAHLHTNEKYETYFKRRIANIVSSYCEHQANECPGATLRLTQTNTDASQSNDDGDDKSVLYAADDESEPLLTQNNVVLLRVEREPANVTRILFAITKSENVGSLNEQMVIDPVKVKYILGSQAGPLARILGGIKLDSVRVSRIRRHLKTSDADNTKLITIISIVGGFFAICYIIGAIRLCRDARRRKRERKAAEDANGLANATTVPNYGSCQRKYSKNGAVLKLVDKEKLPPPATQTNYKEIDECVDNYIRDEPRVLTEREARFMFMCDPSQLPREPTFDSSIALDSKEPSRSQKSSPPRDSVIQENNPTVVEKEVHKTPSPSETETEPPAEQTVDPSVPALVLVPSLSLDSPLTSDDSPNFPVPPAVFLRNDTESPPPDRPRSRRSSRVGDEVLDLREIDGPLEAEKNNNFDLPRQIAVQNEDERNRREHELGRWSSSEGEVDVYYKLSDEEDLIRGDDWSNVKAAPLGAHVVDRQHVNQLDSDSDEDDVDEERLQRDGDIDGYVYERLREELTPVPPDS
ncbi:unnamed protein product [Nippostrongylus brasiliensis]|uniref:Uncharacterized protein n=1 Tax=Nippostrongylus brasiliensis TaxID=27835 RepID=A0A158R2E4_NIPBR|nr:unnamed protein product [Nippostrongylus brasiliensis]